MQVKIYTDGAARGNPDGPGGYGAILHYVDTKGQLHERELSRGYKKTTNNRMELMAAIAALEALTKPFPVIPERTCFTISSIFTLFISIVLFLLINECKGCQTLRSVFSL